MKKLISLLLSSLVLFSLVACEKNQNESTTSEENTTSETTTSETSQDTITETTTTLPQTEEVVIAEINQEHLLVGPDLETIELTGQQILDGEEANMTVQISDDIEFDFNISRGHPNGTRLMAWNKSSRGYNLAYDCGYGNVFDEFGFPQPSYRYQIVCYDINDNGVKDVIIACGNGKDELQIVYFDLVYSYFMDDLYFYSSCHLSGKTTAYIDENGKIRIE